jgi:L-fucose isomerase-like protein
VILLSHGGHNALPAALETLARLQQDGRKGRLVHLQSSGDHKGYARLADAVSDVRAWRRLQRMRLGMLGEPSDWLVASSPNPEDVTSVWGPTVIPIPMSELHAALDEEAAPELGTSEEPSEVHESARGDAIRVQKAVAGLVRKHRLDAITVRCFDLVTERKTTGCLALAQLNDDGIPAACEGDLASAVGMAWVRALLDEPAWMANPSNVDEASNTLVLAHCTVPRSMVGSLRLRSHFESGLGVALAGEFAPGPVTLLRVGGRRLDRVWACDGELVSRDAQENLCRTQAAVRLSEGRVGELLSQPLGNHLILARGHHAKRFRAWWDAFGAPPKVG